MAEQESVWYAPTGGYGSTNGRAVFTHGINVGIFQTTSRNLQQATDEFVNSLQQGNTNLRSRGNYQRISVSGRNGLSLLLSNTNEAGQPEVVNIGTAQLRNGELLYLITVVPESDYASYQVTFANILRSVQLND
jgi:Flp pilus assembly protein TadG